MPLVRMNARDLGTYPQSASVKPGQLWQASHDGGIKRTGPALGQRRVGRLIRLNCIRSFAVASPNARPTVNTSSTSRRSFFSKISLRAGRTRSGPVTSPSPLSLGPMAQQWQLWTWEVRDRQEPVQGTVFPSIGRMFRSSLIFSQGASSAGPTATG